MEKYTFGVIAATLTIASGGTASAALPLVGTSLSGAEWNVNTAGVTRGGYHVYPDSHYVPGYDTPATLAQAGMTIFRFPIDWENVQPSLNGALDATEFQMVQTTVSDLTSLGVMVLIDLHNYGRYDGNTVGSTQVPNSAFADFWSRVAGAYEGNPLVAFDLMNEPHDMPTEQWASAANAAIAAIRQAGASNVIFVEGNGWTGADSWDQNWYGTPDSTVMLTITDPADNYVFEAHQYLDPQSDGSSDTCQSTTIGSERMQPFTDWLRQNGKRGLLGEFNGGANATCYAALTDLLDYLDQNSDVYVGWTWWASGPEWGSSPRVLEPGRSDYAPYMQVLQPHFPPAGTQLSVPNARTVVGDAGQASGGATAEGGASGRGSGGQQCGENGDGASDASLAAAAHDAGAVLIDQDAGAGYAAPLGSSSSSGGCSLSPSPASGYAPGTILVGLGAAFGRRLRRSDRKAPGASPSAP